MSLRRQPRRQNDAPQVVAGEETPVSPAVQVQLRRPKVKIRLRQKAVKAGE